MPKVVPEYKEQARERIVEAAQSLFAEKGYHATRMEDIAARIGVSKRTLYLYYDNKEELFRAMCANAPQAVEEMLRACMETGTLGEACRAFFDATTEGPVSGLNFEILAEASRNPALKRIMRDLYEREIQVIAEVLQEMKAKGQLPGDYDAPGMARALIALYDGLIANLVVGVKRSTVREAWVEGVDRIIGAHPSGSGD